MRSQYWRRTSVKISNPNISSTKGRARVETRQKQTHVQSQNFTNDMFLHNHVQWGIILMIMSSNVIKENIKAPRHWPLCREFTGDRWIPSTNGQLRGKCFYLMTSSSNEVQRKLYLRRQSNLKVCNKMHMPTCYCHSVVCELDVYKLFINTLVKHGFLTTSTQQMVQNAAFIHLVPNELYITSGSNIFWTAFMLHKD